MKAAQDIGVLAQQNFSPDDGERLMTADRITPWEVFPSMAKKSFLGGIMIFIVAAAVNDANAQGPLRRLGDRIREGVQLRLPESPLVPPRSPALRSEPARAVDSVPSRASAVIPNYNAPGTRLQPSMANRGTRNPLPEPRQPAPRAKLGVSVETPAPILVPGRGPRPTRGAVVVTTDPGSGAEAAGLTAGDIIVSINGRIIADVNQFVSRVSELSPGEKVELKYIRNQSLFVATTVMADPTGTVDASTYENIRAMATGGPAPGKPALTSNEQHGIVSPADFQQAEPSALGGIGRAVGSWFGGRGNSASSPSEDETGPPPEEVDPFSRGFDSVIQADVESLQPREKEPALRPTDDQAELLPPPVRVPTKVDPPATPPATEPEQTRLNELLQEVERLQKRVRQLESKSN